MTAQLTDLPIGSPQIIISEKEYLVFKCEVGYWQRMHQKALRREEGLKKVIKKQEGQIRDLRNRLFGKKTEKEQTAKKEGTAKSTDSRRPRGQQAGSKGHGRTVRPNLPEVEQPVDFADIPKCSKCATYYTPDESKESEIIEVEVKAYRRRIVRRCMKKGCSCSGIPNTITAPMPAVKVIPKSPYGISIWESVLLNKFHYSQPTNRLLNQYTEFGLPISAGSITGGLKILKNLFQPVYDALHSQQMTEDRFHNDESGWKVFESIDDKIGNKWWLWVCRSPSVVFFQIAPGRGADVPMAHFQNIEQQKIIVICDRYSAYKSLARQMPFIILAFCWAHIRRDFLDAARKYPELEEWALYWVEKIGELYHINKQRCREFDQKLSIRRQSALFKRQHETLIEKMEVMAKERDAFVDSYQSDDTKFNIVAEVKYKILTSLQNHWQGSSVFVEHPEVPMDNNNGERSIRNPVTGRKNFYGSGSLWSSQLAAIMFSIFQTLALGGINCNHWLRLYLTACAENHGKAPEDLSTFLPWKMDGSRHEQLAKPFDSS
ncbi:MAG: IS66 family transposase [Deltaproteobacteria bacterium]|nr:IS66 family transposase [Deltaproteobacteria bacterium]